jgi:hypothetical protein
MVDFGQVYFKIEIVQSFKIAEQFLFVLKAGYISILTKYLVFPNNPNTWAFVDERNPVPRLSLIKLLLDQLSFGFDL